MTGNFQSKPINRLNMFLMASKVDFFLFLRRYNVISRSGCTKIWRNKKNFAKKSFRLWEWCDFMKINFVTIWMETRDHKSFCAIFIFYKRIFDEKSISSLSQPNDDYTWEVFIVKISFLPVSAKKGLFYWPRVVHSNTILLTAKSVPAKILNGDFVWCHFLLKGCIKECYWKGRKTISFIFFKRSWRC